MSQRALKKREHNQHRVKDVHPSMSRFQTDGNGNFDDELTRRKFGSTPNLLDNTTMASSSTNTQQLSCDIESKTVATSPIGSKSETDLTSLNDAETNLMNAKSEFQLESIASAKVDSNGNHNRNRTPLGTQRTIRLSTDSVPSTGSMTSFKTSSTRDRTDAPERSTIETKKIRVPIVGYEVMEERARFTVYKLRVENPSTNDCWLVLRRYTDFQRLNSKLKTIFPHLAFTLPRKKIFGDNFSAVFLSNRVQGLQAFINAIMGNEQLRKSQVVRDFFCLDEPPDYSESMEECRAIFEAQEETISHLKLKLRAKDDIIRTLQQQLNSEIEKNEVLSAAIK